MIIMLNLLADCILLFFPRQCKICNNVLLKGEKSLCISCLSDIPFTRTVHLDDNKTSQLFWGRFLFKNASSLYYHQKDNISSRLVYKLKYHNQKDIGHFLGKMYALELRKTDYYNIINFLIPVPLHKSRLRKRGYNQSEEICKGMSEILNIPINTNIIFRKNNNITQTKKGKWQRFSNVDNIFEIKNADSIKNKNILLIDDIITTGATIEACCTCINKIVDTNIYIGSIAIADS